MQKFYEHRDNALGMTSSLCALLAACVIGTIIVSSIALAAVAVGSSCAYLSASTSIRMPFEHWRDIFFSRLVQAGVLTTCSVVGIAIYKSLQLAEGGGRFLARSLGGTRVLEADDDLNRRKALNVVAEMAIASMLPTPTLYVLEDEPGINAFAAGLDSKDTVIGVTRGAIDRLKRHQLQGIIAHEFSHIAHQDVRLNVRLLGILSGIQAVAFAANYLIRIAIGPSSKSPGSMPSGKHPLGMALALIFGIVLWPIGQVGALFAKLISLAVNRQREYLADACAVEYTRDPSGLREALEILREDEIGSQMQNAAAQVAGHMFFAGVGTWERLFQTHPPLAERIERLEAPSQTNQTPRQSETPLDAIYIRPESPLTTSAVS
jgi:Zn-dependent protease with chaperone function